VVNSSGRTAPGWVQQRSLLQAEGVAFTLAGMVRLRVHRWRPL
jgi:methylated-DNA-protein-cysteine methyltransferase-like protein